MASSAKLGKDFNDVLDEINVAEQRRYSRMGFTRGYSLGEEAGWREGYLFGVKKGASLATEIGFYQGYTSAWLGMLEKQEQGKARKIQALRALLDMTRSFPAVLKGQTTSAAAEPSREEEADMLVKLTKIRAKFKQVHNLLMGSTIGLNASTAQQQQHHPHQHAHQQPKQQAPFSHTYQQYQQAQYGAGGLGAGLYRSQSPFGNTSPYVSRQASFETQQQPGQYNREEMSF